VLEEVARYVLDQQAHKLAPVTILKKTQIESLVGAEAGGPRRVKRGVDPRRPSRSRR
jgi:hypothetical protein